MKKIINNADNFVEESISGLVKSYPEIYKYSSDSKKNIKCIILYMFLNKWLVHYHIFFPDFLFLSLPFQFRLDRLSNNFE